MDVWTYSIYSSKLQDKLKVKTLWKKLVFDK